MTQAKWCEKRHRPITRPDCAAYQTSRSKTCRACDWVKRPAPAKRRGRLNPEGIIRDMTARFGAERPPTGFAGFAAWFLDHVNAVLERAESIPKQERVLSLYKPNDWTRLVQGLLLWGNTPDSGLDAMAGALLDWITRAWRGKSYESLVNEARSSERAFLDLVRLETLAGRFAVPGGGLARAAVPGGESINPCWPLYVETDRDGFREALGRALSEKPNVRPDRAGLLSFMVCLYWQSFQDSRPAKGTVYDHAARILCEAEVMPDATARMVREQADALGLKAK